MKIGVIMLQCGLSRLTKMCVSSLHRSCKIPFEIILVDNGSDEDSLNAAKKLKETKYIHHLIELKENVGYLLGNNRGLEFAMDLVDGYGEITHLLLANNDVLFSKMSVERMVAALDSDPRMALVSPMYNAGGYANQIYPLPEKIFVEVVENNNPEAWFEHIEQNLNPKESVKIAIADLVEWTAPMIKPEVVKQIGMLEEAFGFGPHHDKDYGIRLAGEGWKSAVVANSLIFHWYSQTINENKNLHNWEPANIALREKWGPNYFHTLARAKQAYLQKREYLAEAAQNDIQ